jgi:hypothetical protein
MVTLCRRGLLVGGDLGGNSLAQAVGPVRRDLDAPVEVLDLGLQSLRVDVALLAVGAAPPGQT